MFESHVFPFAFRAVRRAETRRQLNALSDLQLKDIGLSRDQIDDVAENLSREPGRAGTVRRGLLARGMSLVPLFAAYRST